MIIVKMCGGIGNQLFQYAIGKHLAMIHNSELKLDIGGFKNDKLRVFELENLDIQFEFVAQKELPYSIKNKNLSFVIRRIADFFFSKVKVKKEISFQFNPEVLNYSDNVYLEGYWQSYKYFKNIKDIIRSDFLIKNRLSPIEMKMELLIKGSNSISLHVRRGDYTSKSNSKIYHTCSLEYYEQAVKLMSSMVEEPHFFIFSDDMQWVKDNMSIQAIHTFVENNTTIVDLYLMSICNHNITANSTFSWWGAYLGTYGEKKVITPEKWFLEKNDLKTKDLLPTSWCKI